MLCRRKENGKRMKLVEEMVDGKREESRVDVGLTFNLAINLAH